MNVTVVATGSTRAISTNIRGNKIDKSHT